MIGLAIALACLLVPLRLAAEPSEAEAWAALARPGTVALMRHAYAPGNGDPEGFKLDDCATQRNLNDQGRAQARATGEAMRRRGIRVATVISSPWCRCKETAALLDFGPVGIKPWLMSVHAAPSQEAARTKALRAYVSEIPIDKKTFIVTHQFNIRALLARPTASGAMVVVEPTADGAVKYLGSIHVKVD